MEHFREFPKRRMGVMPQMWFYLLMAPKIGWMPLTGVDTYFLCAGSRMENISKTTIYVSNHVEIVLNV